MTDELYKLVTHISGKKTSTTAIVIPSGTSLKLLSEHLKILTKQNYTDFDVIILGQIPEATPPELNIIHFNENYRLGSSGGFGIGQVIAYKLGYLLIINADVDCFPVSHNLIEKIIDISTRTGKAVMPKSIYVKDGVERTYYAINQYGILSRKILDNIGLQMFRFFRGAEDYELIERLEINNLMIRTQEVIVTHPYSGHSIIDKMNGGSKYLYYQKSFFSAYVLLLYYSIMKMNLSYTLKYIKLIFFWSVYYYIFSMINFRSLLTTMIDGYSLNFDKRYYDENISCTKHIINMNPKFVPLHLDVASYPDDTISGTNTNILNTYKNTNKNTIYFKQLNRESFIQKPLEIFSIIKKYFNIMFNNADYLVSSQKFYDHYGFLYPYLMMLKPIQSNAKLYSWKTNPLIILAVFITLPVALPVTALIVLYGIIKIIFTVSYPLTQTNLGKSLNRYYRFVSKVPKQA